MNSKHLKLWFATILFIAGSVALVPARVQAQASGQTTPPPAEAETAPKALPTSQITLKAEETAAVLRSMRDRPIVDKPIEEIRDKLPAELGSEQEAKERPQE